MSEEVAAKTFADYAVPASVVTRVDLSRLVRELEWVDNELTAAAVRAKTGAQQSATPSISDSLEQFLTMNKLTLQTAQERTEIIKQLRQLKDKAPIIHMTFAVQADRESLQNIAQWLRNEVHPQALVAVGLQPALVAGVYLRTPNKVMDLSMRAALRNSQGILMKQLGALRG